jgi:hypothetical protein
MPRMNWYPLEVCQWYLEVDQIRDQILVFDPANLVLVRMLLWIKDSRQRDGDASQVINFCNVSKQRAQFS